MYPSVPVPFKRKLLPVSLNYARSRLMLGITTVGFWVVMTTLLLVLQLNAPAFTAMGFGMLGSTLLVVGGYILLSIPFDILGGFVLPTRFGRSSQKLPCYLVGWLRGAILHGVVLAGASLVLLQLYHSSLISSANGLGYIAGLSVLGQLILLLLQPFIARLVAHFDVQPSEEVGASSVWDCNDIGFTGGLPVLGTPSILPEHWLNSLPKLEFALLQERREFIRTSHMYPLGIVLSIPSFYNRAGCLIPLAT
jgi:hypothetical protein